MEQYCSEYYFQREMSDWLEPNSETLKVASPTLPDAENKYYFQQAIDDPLSSLFTNELMQHVQDFDCVHYFGDGKDQP